ncbi:Pr6Pr family membrane protein [Microbacterium hydrocarbonoxydans]|uniref:Pr6Pr family membrane protein n=1 Tax=Microbacterium hydrocarbonoxydans TaxID=273678 RepID=UPI00203BAFD0|nr:Pr6Pr family membrane protein [Microbacterium hydrocarbonoxydans]MCM3781270.1 Pr6Pr family membrane protein [Microbacterium hydrocarbonoxydans]
MPSCTRTAAAITFRFAFAGASLVALGYQLFTAHIPLGYSVPNFFLYFTNLSNIILSAVFIIAALRSTRQGKPATTADTAIRGASVVYIAFVGLVFNTLLRDADLSGLIPWVNIVLHIVLPLAGILDWILWPPQNRIPRRAILWWMIFPAAYAAFSIVRGALTGFYPYPFFNPDAIGGYGAVALYCGGMIAAFIALAIAVRSLGNWRNRISSRRPAGTAASSPLDDFGDK